MKLRRLHRNNPAHASGTGIHTPYDTLSRISIACLTLSPDGKITEINAQACKDLHIGGGGIFRIR